MTSESHPIRVDFIPEMDALAQEHKKLAANEKIVGRLGMTFGPGKVQPYSATGMAWNRSVDVDVKRLCEEYKMSVLVSLMEDHEYERLAMTTLFETCKSAGVEVVHFPIRDSRCAMRCAAFTQRLPCFAMQHTKVAQSVPRSGAADHRSPCGGQECDRALHGRAWAHGHHRVVRADRFGR